MKDSKVELKRGGKSEYLPRPEAAPLPPEKLDFKAGKTAETGIAPRKAEATGGREMAVKDGALAVPALLSENYKKVEKILEEGLEEIYFRLAPSDQQEFKRKGEETIAAILKVIAKPRIKIGKIVALIKKWLRLIPGVNRFFLEQTAKIKADKITNSIKKS